MSSTAVRQPVMQEEHKPAARGLGWYGMVFFIASEDVFFANLFASYLYLRVRNGSQFNSTHFTVDKTVALVNQMQPGERLQPGEAVKWVAGGVSSEAVGMLPAER